MNTEQMFKIMQEGGNHLKMSNDDGFKFLNYVLNKGALSRFKITINYEKGKTLFEKSPNRSQENTPQ